MHNEKCQLAGTTTTIKKGGFIGLEYQVEDWWDRVYGKSWMDSNGNPAAMNYGVRAGLEDLPLNDEVLYGKIGPFGHLVHMSEIGDVEVV